MVDLAVASFERSCVRMLKMRMLGMVLAWPVWSLEHPKALTALRRAVKWIKSASFLYDLGNTHLDAKDFVGAAQAFQASFNWLGAFRCFDESRQRIGSGG